MKKLLVLALAAIALAACSPTDTNAPQGAAPAPEQTPAATASLDQPEDATPPASADDLYATRLSEVLAGDWRPEAEKARDVYRHPAETLAFFKVRPNQTVIEITPGGGWYAAVLAPWIAGGDGQYIAAVARDADAEGPSRGQQALEKRFAENPQAFAVARIETFDPKAPVFGAPESADRVLTFRNVHNWAMGGTAEAMFKGFFDVLKPGGVLGVADHRATRGESFDAVKESGYLPVEYVVDLATRAGFVLDAESEINANAKDDHHHEKGVWTLPPTLALGDQGRQKYLDIGESDRMTLRFVKPLPDEIHSTGMDDAPTSQP